MSIFLKRGRGSVTVLVTLVLVPTVFFTSFMVDLVRMKMSHNMAITAADNYGESLLTNYDNLLKEVYGLFAMSQEVDPPDDFKEKLKQAYSPASGQLIQHVNISAANYSDYYLPFNNASVEFSYDDYPGANLNNTDILGTQIGDFMKFRIAQELADDEDGVIKTLEMIQDMADDAKTLVKKRNYDKKAQEALEAVKKYYEALRDFRSGGGNTATDAYPNAVKDLLSSYSSLRSNLKTQLKLEEKREDKAIKERDKKNNDDDPDNNDDRTDKEVRKDCRTKYKMKSVLNGLLNDFSSDASSIEDRLDEYDNSVRNLENRANDVGKKLDDLESAKNELINYMNDGSNNVSDDLKKGINQELDQYKSLIDSKNDYTRVSNYLKGYENNVRSYSSNIDAAITSVSDQITVYLGQNAPAFNMGRVASKPLSENKKYGLLENTTLGLAIFSANTNSQMLSFLNDLYQYFDNEDNTNGKKKQKEANKIEKNNTKILKEDENTSARDIPSGISLGSNGDVYGTNGKDINGLINDCSNKFDGSKNAWKQLGDNLLNKFYVTEYDFGMFSSRTTNITGNALTGEVTQKTEDLDQTLTNINKSTDVNYLYQTELEYILCGNKSSKKNLNGTRNRILMLRAVISYVASYRIQEINSAINEIATAAGAVNPIFGIVAGPAMRAAFAAAETTGDWKALKTANSIPLLKTKLSDCTALDQVKSLLNLSDSSTGTSTNESLKMDYDTYLMVMIFFFEDSDTVINRTGDLITLNMNNIKQQISSTGQLSNIDSFKTSEAVTAVYAKCKVNVPYAVIPTSFMKQFVPEIEGEITDLLNGDYSFGVIRSY